MMEEGHSRQWMTFAGGVLLGTAVATGSAFVLLKYSPSFLNSTSRKEIKYEGSGHNTLEGRDKHSKSHYHNVKRRNASNRTNSPSSRHFAGRRSHSHGSGLPLQEGITAATNLGRTLTSDMYYYQTPIRDHGHDVQLGNGKASKENGFGHEVDDNAYNKNVDSRRGKVDNFDFVRENGGYYTGGETDTVLPSGYRDDAPSETDGGNTTRSSLQRRERAIYVGPADRSNYAAQEAVRHTGFVSNILPQLNHAIPVIPNSQHHSNSLPPPSGSYYGQSQHLDMASPATSASGKSPSNINIHGNIQSPINQMHHQTVPHVSTADALATEGRIIEDAALHEQYAKVITPEPSPTEETEEVCWLLHQALEARKKWVFKSSSSPEELAKQGEAATVREALGTEPFEYIPLPRSHLQCRMHNGVVQVFDPSDPNSESSDTTSSVFAPPGSSNQFFATMLWLLKVSAGGSVRSYCHHRLQLLEQKFNLHVMLNADKEFLAQKSAPHRDFYNVRKVDTHVHHSACMHQKHLLRFIKSKLKKEGDEVVIFRDGKYLTLKEVFESLNLTPYDLSVDSLDVHADKNIFHRFDKFNLKYNPFGQSRLREIFIKQDNLIHGRYLAEVTREVFADLEASKYQHTEYRISIYGRKPVEWDTLAAWVVQNRLYSDNNVWMVQIPRLFNVYKAQGILDSFQQFLDNVFLPLFEATLYPDSHPMLHVFLRHVSGFDLVDDESKPERKPTKQMPTPEEWTIKHNPAYAYYTYYVYANLHVLNQLRESRGLNTFSLRPHCGEAGDLDHLAAGFLLCENIAHGINLRKSPPLQFLYYLSQIGLCMSPLSNNSLFLDYHRNPFPQFFARGLSVSLSTDDPLQIHLTREPLVEEYSVAAQVWKLSGTDLSEVARNSVLHSGFPFRVKMHWVHDKFWLAGPDGNNIQKTNVPALRMCFRRDCHVDEMRLILSGAAAHDARMRGDMED